MTDDYWVKQKGSDVVDLAKEGIEIRTDSDLRDYMHNKFVVVDRRIVMTGSYNWTTHASTANQENLVVMENNTLVEKFSAQFEVMWKSYRKTKIKAGRKAPKKTQLHQKYLKYLRKQSEYHKKKVEAIKEAVPASIRKTPKKIKASQLLIKPSRSKKIRKTSKRQLRSSKAVDGPKKVGSYIIFTISYFLIRTG